MPLIPAFRKLRQKNYKRQVTLNSLVRSHLKEKSKKKHSRVFPFNYCDI